MTDKILYVVVNAPPLTSGRALQALKLKTLMEDKYHIEVVSLDQTRVSSVSYNKDVAMRLPYKNIIFNLLIILKYCLNKKIKHIHLHGLSYPISLTPILKLFDITLGLHMSAMNYDDPKSISKRRILSPFYKRISYHLVQRQSLENYNEKCTFVPNVIDINPIDLKVRLCESEIHIAIIGVICDRKQQLVIAQHFNANKYRNITLHFFGDYNNSYNEFDSNYVSEFMKLVSLNDNMIAYGHLTKEELGSKLSSCDYYFSISKNEGMSNAYLDCLSNNLVPIVFGYNIDELYDFLGVKSNLLIIDSLSEISYDLLARKLSILSSFNYNEAIDGKMSSRVINEKINKIYKSSIVH